MVISTEVYPIIVGLSFFPTGMVFIIAGLWKMLARDYITASKTLANNAAEIAGKSLTSDLTRLAETAAELTDHVNSLIRTSAGTGLIMVLVGCGFIMASLYLVA